MALKRQISIGILARRVSVKQLTEAEVYSGRSGFGSFIGDVWIYLFWTMHEMGDHERQMSDVVRLCPMATYESAERE